MYGLHINAYTISNVFLLQGPLATDLQHRFRVLVPTILVVQTGIQALERVPIVSMTTVASVIETWTKM